MSFLHVHNGGDARTFEIHDGKSDSLHRHVHLDTGDMYYFMGKQIGGKPINPNGKLGRELWALADSAYWSADPIPTQPEKTYPAIACAGMACLFFLVVLLRYC